MPFFHCFYAYRFGFNGKEADNEINGTGNDYDFGARIYDARLGRRWNRDPIVIIGLSPYSVFKNNSMFYIDPFGLSPEGNENGPVGEKQNNGPGMMDDGKGQMEIPEENYGNLDKDPNDCKRPQASDFEINVAKSDYSYNGQVGINVLIDIKRKGGATTTIEGLQIIQIATYPKNNSTPAYRDMYSYTKDKWKWYGVVDGGIYSKGGEVNKGLPFYYHNLHDLFGTPPELSLIRKDVDENRRAMCWNSSLQVGTIRAYDYPYVCTKVSVVNFETIVIGVNANCQGMDIIWGSFSWGTEDFGYDKTGVFGEKTFPISLPVTSKSLKILFNDYKTYKILTK